VCKNKEALANENKFATVSCIFFALRFTKISNLRTKFETDETGSIKRARDIAKKRKEEGKQEDEGDEEVAGSTPDKLFKKRGVKSVARDYHIICRNASNPMMDLFEKTTKVP